ncbi:hypothetical protein pipiens_001587 [Culex pipiens pipiens]|uniref:Uncharacterized protein n=1 Tax=Culex pipiens pipiens TaxID=38569 RepID=A0ABD1CHI1_CULPP
MSFFTSFQELLDFDHSTNLNGFHFSNSLFGFDSNSLPTLENLPPPGRRLLHYNHHVPQLQPPSVATPAPPAPKFQLKVTPNNEIYISNESGTFCELAGSFVPSSPLRGSPEMVLEEAVPEPAPKTLFCVERSGLKRPLSPSDRRYGASGIFHVRGSPSKKKSTSAGAGADGHGSAQPEGAKLVVSNVINNGLIVNKKHLSTTGEEAMTPTTVAVTTPERRIMRPKKRKRKIPPKAAVTLEAKLEPPNGRIVTKVVPKARRKEEESTLNFSGIKEKAAQEAIFTEKVPEVVVVVPPPPKKNGLNGTSLGTVVAAAAKEGAVVAPTSPSSPVELKVVADLVMDKEVFGHISLLNTSPDRGKTVIYQNPVTSRNVIYSILNPKSLNLALAGVDRSTTATLTLQPHRGGRKPKKRGRKPKALTENNGVEQQEGASAVPAAEPLDPSVPVMVTRSGRLSKPPRYANNFFQNMKQKGLEPSAPLDPPPPPPPLPPPLLPDPETAEKLPNFSAALNSVEEQQQKVEVQKRKMTVPLQYRCATCNKIYLGKRMQRHLQKYPSHNSAEGERGEGGEAGAARKDKEEKSTYLYKHLFDLLQRFTEKDKGRIMLKEISNFVDFVRALIPRLITNDEQNSTVEYIDHNVADVLRLNHGKYRLKLSSLAEEYEKLNLTVNLLDGDHDEVAPPNPHPPITSTPNADRATFSFNADDLLNQSSSFPSLTTLMHEHHVLNTMLAPTTNNNHYLYNNNVPQQQQLTQPQQQHYTHNHHHHLNSLPAVLQEEPVVVSQPLAGLCKSPVQHHHLNHHHGAASAGMVNMALNLY